MNNNDSKGQQGVDPQPNHGNDEKGHNGDGNNNGHGHGNGGGGVSKPGRSHALSK